MLRDARVVLKSFVLNLRPVPQKESYDTPTPVLPNQNEATTGARQTHPRRPSRPTPDVGPLCVFSRHLYTVDCLIRMVYVSMALSGEKGCFGGEYLRHSRSWIGCVQLADLESV